jgi:hypothetical protein
MAQINFDASQVDPAVPFEVLPSDKYLVEVTKSEMKATKSGDGSCLELEYTVLDGAFKGRKVWDRLCLNHRTQKTVEIARANLSAICHAVGVMKPRESGELHHIPFTVTVKLKKEKDSENIYNEVKDYGKRVSVVVPPAAAPSQPAQYPQADNSTPPWIRS